MAFRHLLALAAATLAPDATWDRVVALMKTAVAQAAKADHAAAAATIAAAEAVADAPAADTDTGTGAGSFRRVLGRADMALMHAREVRLAGPGDPCPHLLRARTLALRAQDLTANDGEVERRDAVRGLVREVDDELVLRKCTTPTPSADPALVGHWYLHDVRETGSELLLRADGGFDWFISYGAVDQTAKGTWTRDGDAVVLAVPPHDAAKPLYALLNTEPWGVEAEQERIDRDADAAREAVIARCPFLDGGPAVDAAAAPRIPDAEQPDPQALRTQAAAALGEAVAAHARAETTARAAVRAPGTASTEAARAALADWNAAWSKARAAAREAGQPMPEFSEPTMPPACTVPPRADAAALGPARWTGGIGVRVVDPQRGISARRVRITLRFADGHAEEIVTAARGLALRAGKPASPVTALTLAAPFAPDRFGQGRDATLALPPTTSGIVHVSIDSEQLSAPPFETLRLRIDGDALVPDRFGRGRYLRGQ